MRFLTISTFLLVFILPFILFLLVTSFAGFDDLFYRDKFLEYKVQEDVPQASSLHEKVINFIKAKSNDLPNEFNEREKQHLFDVRNVARVSTIALYVFLILFVLLLIISSFILKVNNKIINFVGKILIFGGLLTVAISLALFLFINYNFSSTFESFHTLFFKPGTYTFDPAKEMLTRIYPEQLFMDLGARISKWIITASAIIILVGALLLFKSKKQKE